jgi:hypothetical protein
MPDDAAIAPPALATKILETSTRIPTMAAMSANLHETYGIPEWYWDSPDRDEIADLVVRRVGALLMAAAPEGWRRLDLVAAMSVSARQVVPTAVLPDGSARRVDPPDDLDFLLTELRELKNEPGLGTWLSVRLTVDPDGAYAVWFNFAQDPRWDPPLEPAAYRRDLDAFPRDDQWVPYWYRERMAGRQPVDTVPVGPVDAARLADEVFSELKFLLPAGWDALRLDALARDGGLHLTATVTSVVGATSRWEPPPVIPALLSQHRETDGAAWTSARLDMRYPVEQQADFSPQHQ